MSEAGLGARKGHLQALGELRRPRFLRKGLLFRLLRAEA